MSHPMLHPPNPHRTDPACYSAKMFGDEAVAVIGKYASGDQQATAKPLFLYLAMQDV